MPAHPQHRTINGQVRHLQGWQRSLPHHEDVKRSLICAAPHLLNALPPAASCRGFTPPVRDQGDQGSCVGHGFRAQIVALRLRAGLPLVDASPLFIWTITRVHYEHDPLTANIGVQPRNALRAVSAYGACRETDWPYSPSNYYIEPSGEAKAQAKAHIVTLAYKCPTLKEVKASIHQGFGVGFGFACPETIDSEDTSRTGIIQYPKPSESIVGGHYVYADRYDDDKECLDGSHGALGFLNSWSEQWGEAGFGWLPYAFVNEGLADDFATIRSERL
jgi:C1A family cysteine protease